MTIISGGPDRFQNIPVTDLNGAINSAVTSIVVDSALGFPNPGPYRILIDNEQMQVVGGYGTLTWTVIRAVDGTIAASHADEAPVTNNITAFDYNSFRQEFNPLAYGALGDGVADDSTAFQNCINDAHALTNGGHIYLRALPFKIVSTLTTYANVVFVTYGAVISGAGSASVTPIIRWTQLGGLTTPGALVASNGLTVTAGGLTISSGGLTLTGGGTINGNLTLSPTQSSGQTGLTLSGVSVTGVTAETIGLLDSAQTLTITSGYTNQRFNVFKQHTITAASGLTVANAATIAIEDAPIAGGSAIITNRYALWVQAGITKLDGAIVHSRNAADTIPVTAGTNPTGVTVYIQAGAPGSPNEGDLWFAG